MAKGKKMSDKFTTKPGEVVVVSVPKDKKKK